jgi:hypothetical protein
MQTRLTTNGSLLTREKLEHWKTHGLDGVNVSIPLVGAGFQELTNSLVSSIVITDNVKLVKEVFGAENARINIPLCKQNMEGNVLEELLWLFLFILNVKVTICEDVLCSYTIMDKLPSLGLKLIKDTGHGLMMLDFHGKELGCYSHKDNYKEDDLIVSPVGVFPSWDGYCQAVGVNPPVK